MAANLSLYQVTSVIWAVVSDGKQAYGFQYRKDETIFKDKVYVLRGGKSEHPKQSEPSTSSKPADPAPKVTNETVKNFIPTIAQKLEQALQANTFDYVVIVAPRKTLDALRNCLSEKLRNRVLMNMPDGYTYDRCGAIFALREEATAHFNSYTDTICRSLPPCCTREVESGYSETGARINRYRSGGKGYGDHEIYVVQ